MDVDGHSHQKDQVTPHEPGVIEPGEVVVEVVGEVASLEVAVDPTDTEGSGHWGQWSTLASRECGIEKCPAVKETNIFLPTTLNKK